MVGAQLADASQGEGWLQFGELLLAFGLSSIIGLERQIRRKSAGLRTQAIVGTASALILLVSKYGFTDVLSPGTVVLDPSRVAAQIVSGIGFLGAGLILTRRGTISGLTTAASVWETAAIGMAAGAGLPLLALAVTALHFIIVLGFTPLIRHLPGNAGRAGKQLRITYVDRRGVLRQLMAACTAHHWTIESLAVNGRPSSAALSRELSENDEHPDDYVTVTLQLTGPQSEIALHTLGAIDGVAGIDAIRDGEETE